MYYGLLGLAGKAAGSAYGTLTTAWIAATGETDLTILGALNTLETDLTTYGLTSKMKALYPFVGGTAGKHSYNFMNTAQYQLTFNGGWTHSSNGSLPNGTNAFANTGLVPSSALSLNNTHVSFYSRTDNTGLTVDIGSTDAATNDIYILPRFSGSFLYSRLNSSTQVIYGSIVDSLGLFLISRIASNEYSVFQKNTKLVTGASNSTGLNSISIYLAANNNNGSSDLYSNRQLALSTIGEGLTDTQAGNLNTAVQAFQTTLSRQV
jgi:hypothetical protein